MGLTEDHKALNIVADASKLWRSVNVNTYNQQDVDTFFDAMPIAQVASIWSALQRLTLHGENKAVWAAQRYFEHLPDLKPQRALDLVTEVLTSEQDKPTVMQLNYRFMPTLVEKHGEEVIDRIEAEANQNSRFRWLLGGILYWRPSPDIKDRIEAIAEVELWKADKKAHKTPSVPLDYEKMSLPELARAWVEQRSKCKQDIDKNFFAMMHYESEILKRDPDMMIDLILEILKIETNPNVLGLLAAGPLEDVIGMNTIDRIEREAYADPRFRHFLGRGCYDDESEELKARLDALIGENN
jgi:hypothetical protein